MLVRTEANLRWIDEAVKSRRHNPDGPFEVTQLVNSFLGALAHSWEAITEHDGTRSLLKRLTINSAREAGWPIPNQDDRSTVTPHNVADLLRSMRNGFAHGNVAFHPDGAGEIGAIEIWNQPGQRTNRRTAWAGPLSVADLRRFLDKLVALAQDKDVTLSRPPRPDVGSPIRSKNSDAPVSGSSPVASVPRRAH
jgi:hypothetical protein